MAQSPAERYQGLSNGSGAVESLAKSYPAPPARSRRRRRTTIVPGAAWHTYASYHHVGRRRGARKSGPIPARNIGARYCVRKASGLTGEPEPRMLEASLSLLGIAVGQRGVVPARRWSGQAELLPDLRDRNVLRPGDARRPIASRPGHR